MFPSGSTILASGAQIEKGNLSSVPRDLKQENSFEAALVFDLCLSLALQFISVFYLTPYLYQFFI